MPKTLERTHNCAFGFKCFAPSAYTLEYPIAQEASFAACLTQFIVWETFCGQLKSNTQPKDCSRHEQNCSTMIIYKVSLHLI